MLILTDGNNYFRRMIEADPTGMAYRKIMGDLETATDVHIWFWDGFNSNSRRREVYPDYKLGRQKPGESIFKSMDLLKKVLVHTRAIQIEVPTYEADDVIATLVRSIPGERVHVRSTDRDYLQLAREGITFDATPKLDVENSDIKLYKMLVGDASDNIPGVKGFGQKTWSDCDKTALRKMVDQLLADEFVEFPENLSNKMREKIVESRDDLIKFEKIISFYDVPVDAMNKGMKPGVRDWNKADAILREYYL